MEIAAAFASLKTAFELARVGIEARDDAKVKEAVGLMSERLSEALLAGLETAGKLAQITAERDALQAKLRNAEERQKKRDRYVLSELRPSAFAYKYQPLEGDATPVHYACQVCLDSGSQSVLKLSANNSIFMCAINSGHNIGMGNGPMPGVITGRHR